MKTVKKPLLLATCMTFDEPDADAPILYLVVELNREQALFLLGLRDVLDSISLAAKGIGLDFLTIGGKHNLLSVHADCPWPLEVAGELDDGWYKVSPKSLGRPNDVTCGCLTADKNGLTWSFRDADYNWGDYENDTPLPWDVLEEYVALPLAPKHLPIPDDFCVKPLKKGAHFVGDAATCGHCGLSWDDSIVTSMTPAPAARCPFEAFHIYPE